MRGELAANPCSYTLRKNPTYPQYNAKACHSALQVPHSFGDKARAQFVPNRHPTTGSPLKATLLRWHSLRAPRRESRQRHRCLSMPLGVPCPFCDQGAADTGERSWCSRNRQVGARFLSCQALSTSTCPVPSRVFQRQLIVLTRSIS